METLSTNIISLEYDWTDEYTCFLFISIEETAITISMGNTFVDSCRIKIKSPRYLEFIKIFYDSIIKIKEFESEQYEEGNLYTVLDTEEILIFIEVPLVQKSTVYFSPRVNDISMPSFTCFPVDWMNEQDLVSLLKI